MRLGRNNGEYSKLLLDFVREGDDWRCGWWNIAGAYTHLQEFYTGDASSSLAQ